MCDHVGHVLENGLLGWSLMMMVLLYQRFPFLGYVTTFNHDRGDIGCFEIVTKSESRQYSSKSISGRNVT